MKTIRVRTSYIGCPYITAGKVYEAEVLREVADRFGIRFTLIGDDGKSHYCLQNECEVLGCNNWEILPEGPSMEEELAEALQKVCNKYASTLCAHDETYRGGLIWEICAHCGAKWADDEGGKPPYKENEMLVMAEAVLAKYKESKHGKA